MGGTPTEVPDRYQLASPSGRVPLGIAQVVLTGSDDKIVPPALSRDYAAIATKAGDQVRLVVVPGAGHFEIIVPSTKAGAEVVDLMVDLATRP